MYNAQRTLARVVESMPTYVDEIIAVDDASKDGSAKLAKELNLDVIEHSQNKGYGGAQKTGYEKALNLGADIIVMLHPDGQHDPAEMEPMVAHLAEGKSDFVIGSRFASSVPTNFGMPRYKYLANRLLTRMGNLVLGTKLTEFHSGYRAYQSRLLETIPFDRNSNGFAFDEQLVLQAIFFGFRISEVPVRTIYAPDSSSIGLFASIDYGSRTILDLVAFQLQERKLIEYKIFERQ